MGRKSVAKRMIALALSLMMVLGVVPLTALAAGYGDKGYDTTHDSSYTIDGNGVYVYITGNGGTVTRISGADGDSTQQYRAVANENWEFAYWSTYYVGPSTQAINPTAALGYSYFSMPGDKDTAHNKTNPVIQINEEMWAAGIYYLQAIFKPKVTISVNPYLYGSAQSIRGNSPATSLDNVFISGSSGYVPYGGSVEVTLTAFSEKYVVESIAVHDGVSRDDFTYGIDTEHNELNVNFTATRPTNVTINVKAKEQTVAFDANTGSGTMTPQVFEYGAAQALTENTFAKAGYSFDGWNTLANGGGTAYSDKQSVSFTPVNDGDSITLYAQWKREPIAAQDNMVTLSQTEYAYSGTEQKPMISVVHDGTALTEGTDYTVTWPADCTNAGVKEVVVNFNGDYTGSVTKSYGIMPKEIGISWSNTDLIYNGQPQKPTAKATGAVNSEQISLMTQGLQTEVGTYQATVAGIEDPVQANNYKLPENKKTTITISYLPVGTDLVSISGHAYHDGSVYWFADEDTVTVIPAADYYISTLLNGTYGDNVAFGKGDTMKVFLKNDNGEMSDALDLSDMVKFDGEAPVLAGIEDGTAYYGDLWITKPETQRQDIRSVTLDGEPMGFAEGVKGRILADNAQHTVVVEDYVGNKTTYTVWVYKNYTVTFKLDGTVVSTQTVGHGKDALLPSIPAKEGFDQTQPVWDKDGKNITAHTEINGVYTRNEYTITFMDENGVYQILTYKHGDAVAMPQVPTKEGYTVKWETTIEEATGDAIIQAGYTENSAEAPSEAEPSSPQTEKPLAPSTPQTGDAFVPALWLAVMAVSTAGLAAFTIDHKKKTQK